MKFSLRTISFLFIVGLMVFSPRSAHAANPLGVVERVTDTQIIGWACDPDKPDAAISVGVLQNAQSPADLKSLSSFTANQPSTDAVKTACNSTTANHGFVVPLPAHTPVDLFTVLAHDINAAGTLTGSNIPLENSPGTSALIGSPVYRTIISNGSTVWLSTKAGWTNLVATDGVYAYTAVVLGTTGEGTLQVKRKRLGVNEPFVTIWSKSPVLTDPKSGLLVDNQGTLHLMYLAPSVTAPTRGELHYEKSNNPQAAIPTFAVQTSPIPDTCQTCRHTAFYDRTTDTIHVTMDIPQQRWYTYKKTTDATWHAKELVYTTTTLTLPNGHTAYQYYYYPHITIFNGMVHIFVTANLFGPLDSTFRGFDGIRHYYRTVGGTTWQNEWLSGPDITATSFADDIIITPQNKLLLLGHYSNGSGVRKSILYTSTAGRDDWSQSLFLASENSAGCFERTADGALHILYGTIGAYAGYAKSTDGTNWQFYQLQTPSGIQELNITAPGCASPSGSALLSAPIGMLSSLSTTQTFSNTPPSQPQGHTAVYLEVPLSALPLPVVSITKEGTGEGTVTATGINCGADCAQSYTPGTSITLTASPASGSSFTGWSGSCTGTALTCTLTMDMNRRVNAAFTATLVNLTNVTFTPTIEGRTSIPANTSFTLTLFTPGTTNQLATFSAVTNSAGKFTLPSSVSLAPGNYDILIKTPSYLKKKYRNVALSSNSSVSLAQLTSADLNSDNAINTLDWSEMNARWFSANSIADINGDGVVNSLDFSYLNANWNKVGD